MAHQFTSGVFLHNKPVWHLLDVVVDGTLPAREVFQLVEADFSEFLTLNSVLQPQTNFVPQKTTSLQSGGGAWNAAGYLRDQQNLELRYAQIRKTRTDRLAHLKHRLLIHDI